MINDAAIYEFREEIAQLSPMDSGFVFDYKRWKNAFEYDKNFIDLFKDFDKKEITRLDVINSFKLYFEIKNQNCFIPFLLTMIWGYGKSGFGPHRTNKYFSSQDNLNHIENAMTLLSSRNLYEAYEEL